MPRKPLPPVARRAVVWLTWKLIVAVSATILLFGFVRLNRHHRLDAAPRISSLSAASTSLPFVRSRIPRGELSISRPKIAFLFLARRDLPLDFLWGTFFEGADSGNFSIYIHSAPGFVFDEATSRSHFFYDRQLKNSIQVVWGESSMIAAERLLLATALQDPENQRFVLLSDSCAPLYNFNYVYNYLISSPRSYVDSFLDIKEKRYNPKMSPSIPKEKWRKGSQWISLIRNHAEVIVDDDVVFSVFERFCKRRPPSDVSKGKLNLKQQKLHNCIPDEHYVQTLLMMKGLEAEIDRRTLTYSVWNLSATKSDNKSWHPITFTYDTAGPKLIKEIKDIDHVYYDGDRRFEWCRANSTAVPCFLFARKFTRGAAMRLLGEALFGPPRIASLTETTV